MSSADKNYDVIVVGAGLIGASFALQLARRTDLSVAVIEHSVAIAAVEEPNQRVVALGDLATGLLAQVGVLAMLDDQSCHPYEKMVVWDENSDGELTFAAAEYDQSCLGHMVDSLQCTLLLQKALGETRNIDVFFEFSAVSLVFDAAAVRLVGTDRALTAQLIVAADGRRSWVRQQAKIFAPEYDFGQQGIVARISSELSHQNTAWQRFLSTGPLAILPLHDNQSSIVWSVDDSYAAELMQLTAQDFADRIAEALEWRLGSIRVLGKHVAFPLASQHAEQYVKSRVALIGDAAHSIHPLAGQGANLGFKDAASLVELLAQADDDSLGELLLLQKYQRARRFDNQQTDFMMNALHRMYRSKRPFWLGARGQGMNWISNSVALKQLLARQAMGI